MQAHGEEVSELTFRELTTEDIIRHGYPFVIYRKNEDDESSVSTKIMPNVIVNYAVDMAGVPRSTIKSLCIEDFMKLQEVIMSFFGGTETEATE